MHAVSLGGVGAAELLHCPLLSLRRRLGTERPERRAKQPGGRQCLPLDAGAQHPGGDDRDHAGRSARGGAAGVVSAARLDVAHNPAPTAASCCPVASLDAATPAVAIAATAVASPAFAIAASAVAVATFAVAIAA